MTAVDVSGMTDQQRLALARTLTDNIKAALPAKLEAAAYSLKSKLPFKIASLREVLIHRVSELATPTMELYERNRLVPAFVMTRAVLETSALVFSLHRNLEHFLSSYNEDELDAFLMRSLLGSRNQFTSHEALNILTVVDHVEREYQGIRQMYDVLCEFTHPNWSGALGSFGTLDHENHVLNLGGRPPPLAYGLAPFMAGLTLFEHYYNDSGYLLLRVNAHFENKRVA